VASSVYFNLPFSVNAMETGDKNCKKFTSA